MNMIEIHRASKHFGELRAVDEVTLHIQRGEMFGLIGHNGAGKSTLFRLMLGLLPLNSGEIRIDGQPVHGEAFRQVRRSVGYLPENVVLYDNLTALETLWFYADLKGVTRASCPTLLGKVGLAGTGKRRVRDFSKGMRQRLGFAQALLGEPKLLLLDEPTTGLDPEGIREFYEIVGELRERGVTAILSSHILAEIQQRVDRLALMKDGRVVAQGTVQALRDSAGLSLCFKVQPRGGAIQVLQAELTELGLGAVVASADRVDLSCAPEHKMRVLGALSRLNGHILDIQIAEPTLEDVFHGYAIAHWPAQPELAKEES